MELIVPDTLVLKIIEHDLDLKSIDTILYILYDQSTRRFVLRGKRNNEILDSCIYSYECKNSIDLANFLGFLLDKKNKFSFILYNYANLPATSNEITFEFLEKYDSIVYELSGYDNQDFSRKNMISFLKMLKNVFNYY